MACRLGLGGRARLNLASAASRLRRRSSTCQEFRMRRLRVANRNELPRDELGRAARVMSPSLLTAETKPRRAAPAGFSYLELTNEGVLGFPGQIL